MKTTNLKKQKLKNPIGLISGAVYDVRVKLFAKRRLKGKVRQKNLSTQKRADLIFYIVCMALPLIMYSISLFGINLNSLLLAFRAYDENLISNFVGFSEL